MERKRSLLLLGAPAACGRKQFMQTLLKTRVRSLLTHIGGAAIGGRRCGNTLFGGVVAVWLLCNPGALLAQKTSTAHMWNPAAVLSPEFHLSIPERILTSPSPELNINEDYGYPGLAIAGKTIIVGEPQRMIDGLLYVGQAYVYIEPPEGWGTKKAIPVAKLSASDFKTQTWPFLGTSAAISGDTIVLGCGYDMGNGSYPREAYVYVKPASGWTNTTESARLQSPSARFQIGGGGAVAIDGDTIIVGCVDTAYPGIGYAGAAAVYQKPPQGWSGDIMPIAVLTDGGLNDSLGWQLAISGDTIALAAPEATVGATGYGSGDIQIYEKPVGGWVTTATPTATLFQSDPDQGNLGYSIAISGDTIVAGCPQALVKDQLVGAAYVFQRRGKHWHTGEQTAKLTANLPPVIDGIPAVGCSVAIDGDRIAVGASEATPPDGAIYGGELFIYTKPATGWHNTSHYTAAEYDPNANNSLQLGVSAGISDHAVITGALNITGPNVTSQGSVYIFKLP
jgi:hypothetical protein